MIKSDITCHRVVSIKLESDHSYMEGHNIDGGTSITDCLLSQTNSNFIKYCQVDVYYQLPDICSLFGINFVRSRISDSTIRTLSSRMFV